MKSRNEKNEFVKKLGQVLKRKNNLIHLNINSNYLSIEECEVFRKDILRNQSLFGFHVSGNSCRIDPEGFIHCLPRDIEQVRKGLGMSPLGCKIKSI